MSNRSILVSRRVFAGTSLGAIAGLALGKHALAAELEATPDQTMGPFYPVTRLAEEDADLTQLKGHAKRALGEVIEVTGRILDRRGNPMRGAVVELWQANAAGRYMHARDTSTQPLDPNFQGFAKLRVGPDGGYRITTIKPAAYASPIGTRPAHIHFDIAGRKHSVGHADVFPGRRRASTRRPNIHGDGQISARGDRKT